MAIQPKDRPKVAQPGQEGIIKEFDDLVVQLRGMLDNLQGRVVSLTNDMQVSADIAARVANILDLDQLLPQLAEEIKEGFDLHHVNIYLVDDERENLVVEASSGEEGRKLVRQGYSIPLNDMRSIAAKVAREGQAIIANDTSDTSRFDFYDLIEGTQSKMAVPMITRGQVIGVLAVQGDAADRFDETDIRVKTTLAEQIAVAIENADAFTRIEEARKELSQANLVVENSSTVLFRWKADEHWTVDLVSDNVDQFGYNAEELLSGEVPYAQMVHPDDLERVAGEVAEYTQNGIDRFQQEYRIVAKDGTVHWTDDRTAIERDEDGNPLFYQGVVIDISDRKQAEEEMRESRNLLQAVFDTIPARVFWKDKNLVYQGCNRLFAQDAGLDDPADIVGKSDYDLFPDAEAEAFRSDDTEVLTTHAGKVDIEEPQTTPDGTHWVMTSKVPLEDADGQITGVLGLYTDITDRKQSEEREKLAYEIGQQLNTMQDPQELLQFAVDLLASALDYYHAHIYLYKEQAENLTVAAGLGEAGQVMMEEEHTIAYDAERSLVASAARTLEPVVVQDVYQNPNHLPNPLIPDTVSEVAIPLFIGSDLLGVLDVQADAVNAFDNDEIRLLSVIANQLSVALSNARQIEETERRLRDLALANEAGRLINAADDTNEMLNDLMALMAQSLGADVAAYLDYDSDADMWQGVAAYGMTDEEVKAINTKGEDFPHGIEAMEKREIVTIDNAYEYESFPMEYVDSIGIRSAMAVPIMGQDEPIATVFITFNNRFHYWLNSEVALLDTIANQVSTSIEARRSQEERLRFFNMSQDMIGTASFDGYLTDVNPAWEATLGWTPEEMTSRPFLEFVHPDDIDATNAEAAKIADGAELLNFTNRYKTKDGDWRWLSWSATPDYENNQIYFAARDITETRAAEEQLRNLGVLVDTSPDFISYTDLDLNLLFINEGGLKMTGYTAEDVHQMQVSDMHDPEGVQMVVEQGIPVVEKGQIWRGENELRRKNGDKIPVEQTIFNLTDDAGEVIGLATIMQDITDRKRAEAEIEKRASQLETVADVATQASNILNLDEMLQNVVDLTKEQFGLYHAHVYILEENLLRLAAGAGNPGRRMVESGHSISLSNENSIVATSARNGESVISNHVRGDSSFMPNPLLPRTRAELAVPLVFNREVIGVLDVQADTAHYFNDEDATIQAILAGQIAVAIQNARAFESVREISTESELVAQVNAALAAAENEQDILAAMDPVFENFDVASASLNYMLDDAGSMLEVVGMRSGDGQAMPMSMLPVTTMHQEEFPIIDLVRTKMPKTLVIEEAETDERIQTGQTLQFMRDMGINALFAIPVMSGGQWVGILSYNFTEPQEFSNDFIRLVERIRPTLTSSVVARRSFLAEQESREESARRARELETVAQVSTATSTLLNTNELLKQVSDLTKTAFGLYHAHIYLFNAEHEMLELAAGAGEAGDVMKENHHSIPLRHETSVVAQSARDRRGVRVDDVTQSPTFLPNPLLPSTRSEMALPMIVGDELIGVLDVQSERIGRFGEEDVIIKSTLAAQVAVAVQNARAYQEQQEVAERLREVDLLKNQFLASMSHELRTPLNSIIGYSEVLLDGGDGELTEDAQEDIDIIYTSGKHLLAIINDILDLAKIEANQMKLHKDPVDLVQILRDVIKTNQVLIGERPIELRFETEVDELIVPIDELRIRQVVMNLFSNAAKFTERGSVTIELKMEDDETARVAVVDTGIGIDDEGMAIVFDQFRQVDGTSTRKAGGTGLGLTITRHLVQMHGGDIHVDSTVGEGSRFWFTLPLIEREDEQEVQMA